jgi:hypothetical protein
MTDTTPTPEPEGAAPADTDAPKPDDSNPNAEAARYRTRLRETEAERDSIAGRLTGYQRKEAERLAAAGLSKASDLWLDGLDVAELLDDDGQVDADRVTAQVAAVLDGRPQLAAVQPVKVRPDRSQGSQGSAPVDSGWQSILKGGRR